MAADSNKNDGGSPLSLMGVIAVLTIIALLIGGIWTVFQSQHSALTSVVGSNQLISKEREDKLEAAINEIHAELNESRNELVNQFEFKQFEARYDALVANFTELKAAVALQEKTSAREPVEKATIDAVNIAIYKRFDLIQSQIDDVNKQIAANLIINSRQK